MTTEALERSKLVMAFLTARFKNDEEAALMLFEGAEGVTGGDILLGMTDLCIAQASILAEIVGIPVGAFLETLAYGNTVIAEGLYGAS